jgi:hypothetical protein
MRENFFTVFSSMMLTIDYSVVNVRYSYSILYENIQFSCYQGCIVFMLYSIYFRLVCSCPCNLTSCYCFTAFKNTSGYIKTPVLYLSFILFGANATISTTIFLTLQNFLLKTMFGKYSCSVKKGREGGGGGVLHACIYSVIINL